MTRALDATLLTELLATSFRPAFFYEGAFQFGNFLRLWTGTGDFSWNSNTWLGNGWLGVPDIAEESTDPQAASCGIILMGVPQSAISLALNNLQRGASGKVWLAAINASGALQGTPYLCFSGKLDGVSMEESAETANIHISYESDLIDLERTRTFRFTKESQAQFYSDDLGFDYVSTLQNSIFWGNKKHENKQKHNGKRNTRQ